MKNYMKNNQNRGFTVVEMLATVAVIVILLAISTVSVIRYIDILKITELDNAAREIYMAAENRAVLLSGSRTLGGLVDDTTGVGTKTELTGYGHGTSGSGDDEPEGAAALAAMPLSVEDGAEANAEELYYVYSTGNTANGKITEKTKARELLPAGTIDPTLLDGDFYIVYDKTSGSVTDVFYAEKSMSGLKIGNGNTFADFYDDWANDRSERLKLKNDSAKNPDRILVGWYNGEAAQGMNLEADSLEGQPKITVKIYNEEELTVKVTVEYGPAIVTDPAIRQATIDAINAGKLTVKLGAVGKSSSGITLTDAYYNGRIISETGPTNDSYSCTWLLDSLRDSREGSATKGQPVQFKEFPLNANDFIPGDDFEVTASIKSDDSSLRPLAGRDENNSLFAKGTNEEYPNTALIAFLRHLQNLDKDGGYQSGVGAQITGARQTADILGDNNKTYPNWKFHPILNSNITNYVGGANAQFNTIRNLTLHVESGANASVGLFSVVSGKGTDNDDKSKLNMIRLVNTKVDGTGGTFVGALVGKAENVNITSCYAYWEPDEYVESLSETLGVGGGADQYNYQLQGSIVGGLVGQADGSVQITVSLAATLIKGTDCVGGLVGRVADGASVSFGRSYADCYLSGGKQAAGLVGDLKTTTASVSLRNCYAAGFILSGDKAAGLCLGKGKTTTTAVVYSVMQYEGKNWENDKTRFFLTEQHETDEVVREGCTYFLGKETDAVKVRIKTGGTITINGSSFTDMTADEFFKKLSTVSEQIGGEAKGFAKDHRLQKDSHPYNLRENLTLSTYSYPGLTGVPHYGDWGAEFKDPSLVYYEHYKEKINGNQWGISGGNARTLVVNNLQGANTILSDGYAVACLKTEVEAANAASVTVRYTYSYLGNDGKTIGISTPNAKERTVTVEDLASWQTTWTDETGSGQTAYFIPLPDELVYSNYAQDCFYRYVKFELYYLKNGETITDTRAWDASGEYFFNPHFAETVQVYDAGDAADAARDWAWDKMEDTANSLVKTMGAVRIRTPRHLYDLSRFEAYYKQSRYSFHQILDLDYATYDWRGMDETTGTNGAKARTSKTIFEITAGETVSLNGDGTLKAPPYKQQPIGSENVHFTGSYDGGCNRIQNVIPKVALDSKNHYAGLFGYSTGTLKNIVYHMGPDEKLEEDARKALEPTYQVSATLGKVTENLYIGGLAGCSRGVINNCAVYGMDLQTKISGADLYVGGLVGRNDGTIQNSAAEAAQLSVTSLGFDQIFIGGFVGENARSRTISTSYAVGRIIAVANANTETVNICGFAGTNSGTITNSYAATDLQTEGGGADTDGSTAGSVHICGFTDGGTQRSVYYLDQENYTYRDTSYSAKYKAEGVEDRSSVTYAELSGKSGAVSVSGMVRLSAPAGFPYPTGVTKNGTPVHYGDWPKQMDLGEMGVFYWEELEKDGETSYYITALAVTTKGEKTVFKDSTLLTAHDDGSVVKNYGYGYYYQTPPEGEKTAVTFTSQNIAYFTGSYDPGSGENSKLIDTDFYLGSLNTNNRTWEALKSGEYYDYAKSGDKYGEQDVKDKLEELMAYKYTFFPWNSYHEIRNGANGGVTVVTGLSPINVNNGVTNTNDTWDGNAATATVNPNSCTFTLTQGGTGGTTVQFIVNPHFAASMSVKTNLPGWTVKDSSMTASPGSANNKYEVRCGWQLQNINWHDINRTDASVGYAHWDGVSLNGNGFRITNATIYSDYTRFPYLNGTNSTVEKYWVQTHDIDWVEEGNTYGDKESGLFYSIAQSHIPYAASGGGGLVGWFGGQYDGDHYTMKNLSISVGQNVEVNTMGLFGVIKGQNALLENVVLYSERGEDTVTVKGRVQSQYRWYAGGVLVGLCEQGTIKNCAVAGYKIKDETSDIGANGGAIGGLVGVTDTDLVGCTAVVDIEVNPDHSECTAQTQGPLRVGGLAGSTTANVIGCYTGGEINVSPNAQLSGHWTITTTQPGSGQGGGTTVDHKSAFGSLYIGRIIGGTGMEVLNAGSGKGNTNNVTIRSCYSYLILPNKDSVLAIPDIAAHYEKADSMSVKMKVEIYNLGGKGGVPYGTRGTNYTTVDFKQHLTSYYLENSGGTNASNGEVANNVTNGISSISYLNLDAEGVITKLNNGLQGTTYAEKYKFGEVTTKVDGLTVTGRYTYVPRNKASLQGRDYPFPTILKMDGKNVHYGAWNLYGFERYKFNEETQVYEAQGGQPVKLDMFSNQEPYEELLKLSADSNGNPYVAKGGTWKVKVKSEDAKIVTATFGAGSESATETDSEGISYTCVTVSDTKGETKGETKLYMTALTTSTIPVTVTVEYTVGSDTYSLDITVNVTAGVELEPGALSMFPNDEVRVPLTPLGVSDDAELELIENEIVSSSDRLKAEVTPKGSHNIKLWTGRFSDEHTEEQEWVDVPYRYTLGKDEGEDEDAFFVKKTHRIMVTLLKLPVGTWEEKNGELTWSIDFGGYNQYQLKELTAAVPEGTTCVGTPDVGGDKKITLTKQEGVDFPDKGVELTVTMQMNGLDLVHTVTITVPKPVTAEDLTLDVVKIDDGIWTINFEQKYTLEEVELNGGSVEHSGSTVTLTGVQDGTTEVTLAVTLTDSSGLRQVINLTVVLPNPTVSPVEPGMSAELDDSDELEEPKEVVRQWEIGFGEHNWALEGVSVTNLPEGVTAKVSDDEPVILTLTLSEEKTEVSVTLEVNLTTDAGLKETCVLSVELPNNEPNAAGDDGEPAGVNETESISGIKNQLIIAILPPEFWDLGEPEAADAGPMPELVLEPATEANALEEPTEEG